MEAKTMQREEIRSGDTRSGDTRSGDTVHSDTRPERLLNHLRGAVASGRRCSWVIGAALAELKKHEYWRELGYASFQDFVQKECDFGVRTAQELIKTHAAFIERLGMSLEDASELPPTRAALVAGVNSVCGSCCACSRPGGRSMPQTLPVSR